MTQKNNGGPAFPVRKDFVTHVEHFPGMALRDWFAGQALQGMIASSPIVDRTTVIWAEVAYNFADAMLEEREKP